MTLGTDGLREFAISGSPGLLDFLISVLDLDRAAVNELLPQGFPAIPASISRCRVGSSGILLDATIDGAQTGAILSGAAPQLPITFAISGSNDGGAGGRLLSINIGIGDRVNLAGNVSLEERTFGLSLLWTDGSPTLGSLLQRFDLDRVGFGEASLTMVSLRCVEQEILTIDLTIANLLTLEGHDFRISDAELALSYVSAGDSILVGSAVATGILGQEPAPGQPDPPIRFDLSASFDGPDLGWTFAGSATNISVATILSKFGLSADSPFDDLQVETVELSFNTVSKDFRFRFTGKLTSLPGVTAEVQLARQPDGSYQQSFSGTLTIGTAEFDLAVEKSASSTVFAGVFTASTDGGSGLAVREMVAAISSDLANHVPAEPAFFVKDALFAFQKEGSGTPQFLFAIDTDFSVNLSGLGSLPLIGQSLGGEEPLDLAFEVLLHSDSFSVSSALRSLLPAGAPRVPDTLAGNF